MTFAGWEVAVRSPDEAFTYGDENSPVQIFPESDRS